MLRGIQKNIIQMRTPNSRFFEEVYFILRAERRKEGTKDEMLAEANRILSESDTDRRRSKKGAGRVRGKIYLFFFGLLSGASLVAVAWLAVLIFG